jgi:hypothetical protein
LWKNRKKKNAGADSFGDIVAEKKTKKTTSLPTKWASANVRDVFPCVEDATKRRAFPAVIFLLPLFIFQ